jgi:hypothetical protein
MPPYLTILRVQQPARRLRKVFRLVGPWSPLRILLRNVFSYDHLYSRRSSVSHCLIVRLEMLSSKSFKIVPSLWKQYSGCVHRSPYTRIVLHVSTSTHS